MNAFMEKSGYIVTYKDYQNHPGFTHGNKITADYIKAHSGIEMFQSPIDDTTGSFRKILDSKVKAIYTEAHQPKFGKHRVDDILDILRNAVKDATK
jgi:hypothetical protein